MNSNQKKIIALIIVIILIIGSYFIWNLFFVKEENKYLTVKELYDDWDKNEYYKGVGRCNFKSFDPGDNIVIEDYVISSEIIELPVIEINKTDVEFSKASYLNETYTLVTFKSGRHLGFKGNRLDEFPLYKTVKFSVQVKEYDYIPIYYELYGGEMIEEFYYDIHQVLAEVLEYRAKTRVIITLGIENTSKYQTTIKLFDIRITEPDPNNFDEYDYYSSTWGHGEDIRISLFRNNEKIDEIISVEEINMSSNGHVKYEPGDYRLGSYEIGDKIIVTDNFIGNQTYKIEIYWRHTYPEPGHDEEKVVGSIEFVM